MSSVYPKCLPDTNKYHQGTQECIPGTTECLPGNPKWLPCTFQCLPGTPKCLPSASKIYSWDPKCLPGTPKCLPFTLKYLPGTPKMPSGTPKCLSGTPKNVFQVLPKYIPGTPKCLRGTPKSLPGPQNIFQDPKISSRNPKMSLLSTPEMFSRYIQNVFHIPQERLPGTPKCLPDTQKFLPDKQKCLPGVSPNVFKVGTPFVFQVYPKNILLEPPNVFEVATNYFQGIPKCLPGTRIYLQASPKCLQAIQKSLPCNLVMDHGVLKSPTRILLVSYMSLTILIHTSDLD